MPWILSDYKSQYLDLNNPNSFRDLTQPIGALNKERLNDFMERYNDTPPEMERFLYGSHFSCPGYVIGFRLRSNPQWMIKF
jgi:factor associated with neutral sphingomyelinase activation